MINIGSLVGTLELQDNATSKLAQLDYRLHQTFGAFALLQDQTKVLGLGIQQFGTHISRTGDRLTQLTAAVTAAGIASVVLATKFQTNMMKIANLTEIGVQGVGKMREAILKMGPEVAQGPIALSQALYSIGSVGLTGSRALQTLEKSAKASSIGLGETADVARAISAAVINFADSGMTASRAADILTVAVKEGGAEADSFARTLGRVIATGRTLNVSFEEITASVATFTRLGVRADEAVTGLRGTFAFLMKPSATARKEIEAMGLSMDQLRQSVKERGLAATLVDLVRLTKGNEDAIGRIIPNVRALAGVLANAGSQADEYGQILEKIKNSNGALDESFQRVSETVGFKFQAALARLQSLAIQLGDMLLPAVVDILEAATPLFDLLSKILVVFGNLPTPIKIATASFIAFALAIGPIMSITGRMVETVGLLTRLYSGLEKVLKSFLTTLTGVTFATAGLTAAQERGFRAAVRARTAAEAARRMTITAEEIPFVTPYGARMPGGTTIVTTGFGPSLKQLESSFTRILPSMGPFYAGLGGISKNLDEASKAATKAASELRNTSIAMQLVNDAFIPMNAYAPRMTQAFNAGANSLVLYRGGLVPLGKEFTTIEGEVVRTTGAVRLLTGETTTSAGLISRAFTLLTGTIGGVGTLIAATYTGMAVGAAALTDRTEELKKAVDTIPAAFGLIIDIGKQSAIVLWHDVVAAFDAVVAAIGRFVTSVKQELPGVFQLLSQLYDQYLIQWYSFIEQLKWIDNKLKEMTRTPITLGGVQAEALERYQEALAGARGGGSKPSGATKEEKRDLSELLSVYDALNLKLGQQQGIWQGTREETQIVMEKLNGLSRAIKGLPEERRIEIELFMKLHTPSEVAPGEVNREFSFAELRQMADKLVDDRAKQLQKLHQTALDVDATLTKVDAEIAGLGLEGARNLSKAIRSGLYDQKKLMEDFGSLFSSPEIAEMAFKKLGQTVRAEMQTLRRETSWIENTRIAGVALEAELKKAREQGMPTGVMLEEFGNRAEHLARRLPLAGQSLANFTEISTLAGEKLKAEAEKPFTDMAQDVADLDAILQEGLKHRTIEELAKVFTSSIKRIAEQAPAMGIAITDSITQAKAAIDALELKETLARYDEELREFQRRIGRSAATPAEQAELTAMADRWYEQATARATALQSSLITDKEKNRLLRQQREELEDNARAYISNMNAIKGMSRAMEDLGRALAPDTLQNRLEAVHMEMQRMREDITLNEKSAENAARRLAMVDALEAARLKLTYDQWLRGNEQTRENIAALAADARARFEEMKKSGLFTAEALEKAWQDMVELNIKAQGQWSGSFMELIASMPDVLSQAFTKMMHEAKNFHDFFVGIWNSIKDAIFKVFDDIVAKFIRQTLMKLLGGLLGAKPAATAGFGNIAQGAAASIIPAFGGMGSIPVTGPTNLASGGGLIPTPIYSHGNLVGYEYNYPAGYATAGAAPKGGFFGDLGGGLLSGGKTNWGTVAGGSLMALGGAAAWYGAGESKLGGTLGGAMTGAGIGTMIMPGIGTAIGAGVGAVAGLVSSFFRKAETTKIMESVGKEWGVNISKGLADEIKELSKTLEGGTKDQRRKMAEILSLDKIIAEGGGLTRANVGKYEQSALDLFRPIINGSKQAGAATEELNKLIGMFAAQADKTGGLWSDNFHLMINGAKALKLDLEAVTAAIEAQISKLSSGLAKMIASFGTRIKQDFVAAFTGGLTGLAGAKGQAENIWTALGDPDAFKKAMKDFADWIKEAKKELGDEWLKKFGVDMEKAGNITGEASGKVRDLQLKLRDAQLDFKEAQNDVARYTEKLADMQRKGKSSAAELENVRLQIERAQYRMDKAREAIRKFSDELGKLGSGVDISKILPPDLEKELKEKGANVDEILAVIRAKFQPEFERLSRITLAAFNAIVAQGKSMVVAMDAVGPSVDQLILAQEKLGLAGTEAFDKLKRMRTLIQDNRDLVDSAEGLNDVLVAMANLGQLDEQTFKDLVDTAGATFDELIKKGFTQNEALAMMAPSLETINKLAKQHGWILDDNTQKLINLADEQGLFDKDALSTNEVLMMGFAAIIEALGGKLPDAFKEFSQRAIPPIRDVGRELDDLERPRRGRIDIDTHYNNPDGTIPPIPNPPSPDKPDIPAYWNGGLVRAPYFQSGGLATARILEFKPFGSDRIPLMATEGEGIVTTQGMKSIGPEGLAQINAGLKTFGNNKNLATEIAQIVSSTRGVTVQIQINAVDGASVRRVVSSREFSEELERQLVRNPNGLGAVVRKVAS